MKKLLLGLLFLILVVIGAFYGLLFTASGNSYVASYIEDKINKEQNGLNLQINNFKLTTNDILFIATINENSLINIEGEIAILDKSIDLKYEINIKDLSKLQNLIRQKLNGSFSTKGIIKGNRELAVAKGVSSIASSDTSYNISLVNYEPSNILFNMKHANINELLYLAGQPSYATGKVDIIANIKSADISTLDGLITTKITDGIVNAKLISEEFAQKLKKPIIFNGDILTKLVKTQAISKVDLNSTVTNIDMVRAVFDIEKGQFTSDYSVNFTDLEKLYDITQTKMRGAAKIDGNIKQAKGLLSVNGKSNLFGGNINFNLLNDNFNAKIDGVEIKSLTHMFFYPEIFTSKSNIDVEYNLSSKVGKIGGNLLNGQFKKNQYSKIIKTFAKLDLTKEVYEKIQIKSDMKNNIINIFVDMTSKNTTIKISNSTLNIADNSINALVQANISKYAFDVKINGSLSDPKVKVSTRKINSI